MRLTEGTQNYQMSFVHGNVGLKADPQNSGKSKLFQFGSEKLEAF